jgi:hypothetical protein
VPPQIAQIFLQLKDLKVREDIIDIYEAEKILLEMLEKRGK